MAELYLPLLVSSTIIILLCIVPESHQFLTQFRYSDTRDPATGLCPPGFPRQVVYNGTGECYAVGKRGPCGELMHLFSDPVNPNYGVCACQYSGRSCVSRPLVPWPSEGRCYYAFQQGPCKAGEWLELEESRNGKCQRNLCRQGKREDGSIDEEITMKPEPILENFWFAHNGTCFQTGTQAYCNSTSQYIYFIPSEAEPQCVENPISCSTIDETEPRAFYF